MTVGWDDGAEKWFVERSDGLAILRDYFDDEEDAHAHDNGAGGCC